MGRNFKILLLGKKMYFLISKLLKIIYFCLEAKFQNSAHSSADNALNKVQLIFHKDRTKFKGTNLLHRERCLILQLLFCEAVMLLRLPAAV